MLTFEVPGRDPLRIKHLVLDYNGTMACDGVLLDGVKERLQKLSESLQIHVVTADTFGIAREQLQDVPCSLKILPADNQDEKKLAFVRSLGQGECVCIGNGQNDYLMLKEAALGIALIQREGANSQSISAADVICLHINDALDLLLRPLRLKATLRK